MVGKKIKNTFPLVLYFVQQRWKKTRMSADAKFQLDFLLEQIVSSYLLEIVDVGYLQSEHYYLPTCKHMYLTNASKRIYEST